MNRYLKSLAGLLLAGVLAACGGGGGSSGATATPAGGGSTAGGVDTSTPGSNQTTPVGAISLSIRNSANAETIQIGGTEQARAIARVIGPAGAPISGVIVVFSQADASLLAIAPASGTALTDANGEAAVDIRS